MAHTSKFKEVAVVVAGVPSMLGGDAMPTALVELTVEMPGQESETLEPLHGAALVPTLAGQRK